MNFLYWVYDANGNRTHRNGTEIATFDAQDRILRQNGTTYQHNPLGQRTEKNEQGQKTAYRYDNLGGLREVILPDNTTISYVLDPTGRRVGRKENGQWTHKWIYQDGLNPIAELDENDRIRKAFIYADKGHVPAYMITYTETGVEDKHYRIVSDLLGSVRVVYDLRYGETIQRIDYDVWGNIINDTNPDFQPFGFAGGLYDSKTKLTRFGARDYDAETGRWTAKDPIGFGGGDMSLYGYLLSDPINGIDPSGLAEKCEERKIKDWIEIDRGWKIVRFEEQVDKIARGLVDVITTVKPGFSAYEVIPIMQYIGLEQLFELEIVDCWDECSPNDVRRTILKADPTNNFRENFYVNMGTREGTPMWVIGGFQSQPSMNTRWFDSVPYPGMVPRYSGTP